MLGDEQAASDTSASPMAAYFNIVRSPWKAGWSGRAGGTSGNLVGMAARALRGLTIISPLLSPDEAKPPALPQVPTTR
ncbi:hypothetical protein ABTL18_20350, partial [Acinetobacter baumannii]